MRDPLVLLFATITVICVLCMGAFWPIPVVSWSFAIGGGLSLVGFSLNLARALRTQKYSLAYLREYHERREAYEIDVPGVADNAGVLCMCCGETYEAKFPVCPRCKSGRGCC